MKEDETINAAVAEARHSYAGDGAHKPVMATVNEACRMFAIGRTKMWQLIMSREVESRKLGQRTLVKLASLEAYVEAQPSGSERNLPSKATRLGKPRNSTAGVSGRRETPAANQNRKKSEGQAA